MTRSFRVAALAAGVLVAGSLTVGSSPAVADPLNSSCAGLSFSGTTATVTCNETGGLQSFVFHTGVGSAAFTVDGAEGFATSGFTPVPLGGESSASLSEGAGTVVTVVVGGAGGYYTGGYGGGGSTNGGGGGGGGSFVELGGATLIAAGGGGGDSNVNCQGAGFTDFTGGVGGGTTGGTGDTAVDGCATAPGQGGSQSQGGAAGGAGATAGSSMQGGDGATVSGVDGAGGGGGGYFGGGGGYGDVDGGTAGSGGGGSGFVPAGGTTTSGVNSGNGKVTIVYSPPATSLSVSSDANPAAYGQTVDLTATVAGIGDRTGGTVDFLDNDISLPGCDAVAVSSGQATCTTSSLSVSSHPITASYSGDMGDLPSSTTSTLNQVVNKSGTTTQESTPSPNPSTRGDSVMLSAEVDATPPGVGTPTGTVTFTTGSTPLCSAPLSGSPATASCSTTAIPVSASEDIQAAYGGDGNFSGSDGDDAAVVDQYASATSLSADPTSGSATVGDSVTLTQTIPTDGVDTPGGTVDFTDNGSSINPSCNAVAPTTSAGVTSASCTTTALPAGSSTIAADYSGDTNYQTESNSQSYVVNQATPTVGLAGVPASGDMSGEGVTLTATVTGSESAGTPTGTIDFTDGGASISPACDAATISTTAGVSTATCATSSLPVGSDALAAAYSGDDNYASGTPGALAYPVGKSATTTAVSVGPSTLTATVAPVAPGAGSPTGTVTFSVNGAPVGTAVVSAGTATLTYTTPTNDAKAVSATYSGDNNFTGSSGSTSRSNPKIVAHVKSAHAKTKAGWYRSPVTVSFSCTKGSAPLTSACPGPVRLSHNVSAASVTRTIHATDGGAASVTVSPINIDRTKPTVKVSGAKSGHRYAAPGPTLRCVAHDSRSGVATCRLHKTRHGDVVHYTATATDKAGNTATTHGHYTIAAYVVVGVPFRHGRYITHVGTDYTVDAYVATAHAPRYENAAPDGQTPRTGNYAMVRRGHNKWSIEIAITSRMSRYRDWTLGVRVHGTLHLIPITVVG